jgi:hypothetical protein
MRFTQLFALFCCTAVLFSLGTAQTSKTTGYSKPTSCGDVNGKFLLAALFLEEIAFDLEVLALILSLPVQKGDVGKTFAADLAPESEVAKKLAEASSNSASASTLRNAASLLEVTVGIPETESSCTHAKPRCYAVVIREIKLKALKLLYAIQGLELLAARSLGLIDPALLVEISIQIEELVIKLKQLAIGTYVCCDTEKEAKKSTYGRDYDSDSSYGSDSRHGSDKSGYGSSSRYGSDSRHGSDKSGYGSGSRYGSDSRSGSDKSGYGSDSRHGSDKSSYGSDSRSGSRYGSDSRYGSEKSGYGSDSRSGSDKSGYGYGSDSRSGSDRSSYGYGSEYSGSRRS